MWSMQYGLFPQLFLRNMRRVRKRAKYDFGRGNVPHNTICCSTDAEFKPKVPKYEISIIVNWTKPSLQILMYYFKIVNGRKHLLVLKAEFCKSFASKAAKQYINHLFSRIPSPLSSSSLFLRKLKTRCFSDLEIWTSREANNVSQFACKEKSKVPIFNHNLFFVSTTGKRVDCFSVSSRELSLSHDHKDNCFLLFLRLQFDIM